jgi:hypothetical protein
MNRRAWSAIEHMTPALIVLCAGAADVTRTLDFAQSQSLPIAIHCPAPVETPRALFTIS